MLRRDRSLVRDQLSERTELRLDLPLSARPQELHAGALMNAGSLVAILQRRPLNPSEEQATPHRHRRDTDPRRSWPAGQRGGSVRTRRKPTSWGRRSPSRRRMLAHRATLRLK